LIQLKGLDEKRILKISVIGPDRLGIVFKLAGIIKANGGNIIVQRSLKLATDFALMMAVAFDSANVEGVAAVKKKLVGGVLGEGILVATTDSSVRDFYQELRGTKYVLIAIGDDRMGIIESIGQLMVKHKLNIEAMDSEVVSHRPVQGTATFTSTFETTIPADFDMQGFESAIDQFESDTDVTIVIRPK
jgi:glycine cleavage system regulatory protein